MLRLGPPYLSTTLENGSILACDTKTAVAMIRWRLRGPRLKSSKSMFNFSSDQRVSKASRAIGTTFFNMMAHYHDLFLFLIDQKLLRVNPRNLVEGPEGCCEWT